LDDADAKEVGETFRRRTIRVALVDVQGKAMVDTLADTLAEVEGKTLSYTLAYVEKEALVDMLPKTVAKT